jgi:hypothetical protein
VPLRIVRAGNAAVKLAVVIVNYRTPALTVDCLRSLAPELAQFPGARAFVVDNDSADGSAAMIAAAIEREGFGFATLIAAERNGGFAYGNNVAIRPLLAAPEPPQYVLLLNPDTLVLPGALQQLVAFLEGHPEVGIAGSRIEGVDGAVQRSAFRFHGIAAEFESSVALGPVTRLLSRYMVAPPPSPVAVAIDWVCGASMLVRSSVFAKVGLLDERYFLYYEETDFCLQARRAGFTCWYVPASRVVHIGGQASGLNNMEQAVPPALFESRRSYFLKNHGRLYLFAANGAWLVGFALRQVRRLFQPRVGKDRPRLLGDFLRRSFVAPRAR